MRVLSAKASPQPQSFPILVIVWNPPLLSVGACPSKGNMLLQKRHP